MQILCELYESDWLCPCDKVQSILTPGQITLTVRSSVSLRRNLDTKSSKHTDPIAYESPGCANACSPPVTWEGAGRYSLPAHSLLPTICEGRKSVTSGLQQAVVGVIASC